MSVPTSRLIQASILLVLCGLMAVPPLVNHVNGGTATLADPPSADVVLDRQFDGVRTNKDYTLWYRVGRQVLNGGDLYRTSEGQPFPYMYPPFAALLLAGLSLLGPTGMMVALLLLNAASVALAVELSVRLAAGTTNVSLWLRIVPGAVCVFFFNDMFLLGQPNLGLLVLILGGLLLMQKGHGWAGGVLFAAATAIKAFPAVILVYLLWRRQWAAAGSLVAGTIFFLVVAPAPVRGFDRNLSELKQWADGMLYRQDASGHGQRPEQSVGWRNQSLLGVGNRLLWPANALAEETMKGERDPLAVNVVDLGYRGAMVAVVIAAGLLGLGFVLSIPQKAACTPATDALEFGMLIILMTVGTPYAFGYYFVWLLYPLTVLVHRGMTGDATDRRIAWGGLAVTVLFLAGAIGQVWRWYQPMAYGTLLWASVAALGTQAWLLWRSRTPIAISPAA